MQHSPTKYTALVLAMALGMMALVGGINYFVDPFGITGAPRIEGFNEYKAGADDERQRLAIALRMWLRPTKTVFLGSSATGVGLDPEKASWSNGNAFNAGLPGANFYEVLRYYEHAARIGVAKDFVIGLELSQFLYGDKPVGNFSESWLAVAADGRAQLAWLYALPAGLFSMPALEASWKTLRAGPENPPHYRENGFTSPAAMEKRSADLGGPLAAFEFMENWRPSYQMRLDPRRSLEKNLEHFRALVRQAYAAGHTLRIFFSPRHAWELETYSLRGQWELLEHLKRRVVEIVAEESKAKPPFPVWDFNTYNEYTTEEIPAGDAAQTQMHWHWEWSHYRPALGDLVLERIAPPRCEGQPMPRAALFGECLTRQPMLTALLKNVHARDEFLQQNPGFTALVRGALERAQTR